jgi:hypothetical protein
MRGNPDQRICAVCRKDGVAYCDVKEQGTGGTDGWKKSSHV